MRFRFQFRRYRLPLRVAVRTAHGVWTEREGVIVRLEIPETGNRKPEPESEPEQLRGVGYGEAAVLPWFGTETVDEAVAACGKLGEWIEEEKLAALPRRLGCLRHAIGAALAEVKREHHEWAGEGVKALGVAALLPAGRAAMEQIAAKAESGFRVFKWKVGVGDLADELAIFDDVCAALPSGGKLRLDANGAWDRRKTERWLERCAERPVEFVEQPVAADARGADGLLLGLAQDWPTPLALDESLVGDGDVERWIGAGWPGIFVVKPSLLGDVTGAIAMLAKARADVVFSSALETAIGARAALRVAFAFAARAQTPDKGEGERDKESTRASSRRALGFGVWPLFADARYDGPAAAPFVRWEDVERIDVEAVWNALS
ncbi:MAG TPA: o-succinylbenzoate synthase [Opitutaceae bacterium]|nr:o-succinylbenzoate synthase [Opitutaceae bacterium]